LAAIRDIVEQFDTAALYITHDLAVVAQMADRIKVLLKGDEVEEAETRKMLSSPKEDYTKSLWAVRSFQREQKPMPARRARRRWSRSRTSRRPMARCRCWTMSLSTSIAGRTVAVVGESGSGKSTTARVHHRPAAAHRWADPVRRRIRCPSALSRTARRISCARRR
jgi:peptide/nickel transport system ATP-binding protein